MNVNNPVRKEKLENLKRAKELPFKKRVLYYFDFFKFYILGFLLALVLIYIVLTQMVFAPDVILNGYIVNRTEITSIPDEEFLKSFPDYNLINPKKEKMYFTSDMFFDENNPDSAVKLIATMSSGEADYVLCNKETMERLAQMGLLSDINHYPELSDYSDRFVYYDHTKNDTDEDDSLGICAYGIEISDSVVLNNFHAFHENEKVYICFGKKEYLSDTLLHFIKWIDE